MATMPPIMVVVMVMIVVMVVMVMVMVVVIPVMMVVVVMVVPPIMVVVVVVIMPPIMMVMTFHSAICGCSQIVHSLSIWGCGLIVHHSRIITLLSAAGRFGEKTITVVTAPAVATAPVVTATTASVAPAVTTTPAVAAAPATTAMVAAMVAAIPHGCCSQMVHLGIANFRIIGDEWVLLRCQLGSAIWSCRQIVERSGIVAFLTTIDLDATCRLELPITVPAVMAAVPAVVTAPAVAAAPAVATVMAVPTTVVVVTVAPTAVVVVVVMAVPPHCIHTRSQSILFSNICLLGTCGRGRSVHFSITAHCDIIGCLRSLLFLSD